MLTQEQFGRNQSYLRNVGIALIVYYFLYYRNNFYVDNWSYFKNVQETNFAHLQRFEDREMTQQYYSRYFHVVDETIPVSKMVI